VSIVFPSKVARAIRGIVDEIVPIVGQKAILYRFEGEYENTDPDNPQTAAEEIETLYNAQFSGPIETELFVDWTEVKKRLNDSGTFVEEEEPIEAVIKYDDYAPRKSYYKIGWSPFDPFDDTADVDTQAAEDQTIQRLEIVDIDTIGQETEASFRAQMAVKRTNDELADTDTGPMADVPNGFFEV
jgi:hypothetical protein